jgi:hypothetical protein
VIFARAAEVDDAPKLGRRAAQEIVDDLFAVVLEPQQQVRVFDAGRVFTHAAVLACRAGRRIAFGDRPSIDDAP